ncbi:hypothetical protein AUP68_12449 [Ilyonectria robusta]
MSDDASPSSPARIAGSSVEPFVESSVEPSGSRVAWDASSELATPSRRRAQSQSQRRKKKKSRRKRNPGLARKLEFVTHLLKSLDTLVFVELSALYYMEYVFIPSSLPTQPSLPTALAHLCVPSIDVPCFDLSCGLWASTCT